MRLDLLLSHTHTNSHTHTHMHRYACTCIHIAVDTCMRMPYNIPYKHTYIHIFSVLPLLLSASVAIKKWRTTTTTRTAASFTQVGKKLSYIKILATRFLNIREISKNYERKKPSRKMKQKLATHWGKQHHKLTLNIPYRERRELN